MRAMYTASDGVAPPPAPRAPRILAPLALGLAMVSALAAAVSGLGHRWGWWDYPAGISLLLAAAGGGLGGAVAGSIAAMLAARRGRRRLAALAAAGALLGALVFALPARQAYRATRLPAIHDISTDVDDPPRFVAIAALRRDAANPIEYAGAQAARLQRQAYPDIGPLVLPAAPPQAFDSALAAAGKLGWEIVAADAGQGRIEATDTTFWFGFKDDVVIRIAAADAGSRIDLRSKSRVGRSDLGANAGRIRRFLRAAGGGGAAR